MYTRWSFLFLATCLSGVFTFAFADAAAWKNLMEEAVTAYQARDTTTALKSAYKALKAAEGADGKENLQMAETLYLLGELNLDARRLEEAVICARKAFLIRSNLLGNEAMDVAVSANSLAQLYQEVGEYEKAIPLNDQAIMIWRKELGPDHPNIAVPLNNQAKIYYIAGLFFKQRAEKEHDPIQVENLRTESEKSFAQSIKYFSDALALLKKLAQENDPNLGACQQNLGDVYYATGDSVRAEQLYRQSLANLGKALGPTSPHVIKAMTSLANACFKNTKPDDAEKYYQAALKYTAQSPMKNHLAHILELSTKMAAFYESIGNTEKAAACLAQTTLIKEQIAEFQARQKEANP